MAFSGAQGIFPHSQLLPVANNVLTIVATANFVRYPTVGGMASTAIGLPSLFGEAGMLAATGPLAINIGGFLMIYKEYFNAFERVGNTPLPWQSDGYSHQTPKIHIEPFVVPDDWWPVKLGNPQIDFRLFDQQHKPIDLGPSQIDLNLLNQPSQIDFGPLYQPSQIDLNLLNQPYKTFGTP